MPLTRSLIERLAPDQAALKSASALLAQSKWSSRAQRDGLIWGECQGSGANPYRVAADARDGGSKCTCPSRKFPCKHALALMWMFADEAGAFPTAEAPQWVADWIARRRRTPSPSSSVGEEKSIDSALADEGRSAADPAAEARRLAAAERRAAETRKSVSAATEDLELWISDQLRLGLASFLAEPSDRCRRIAARLVDAKAGALASRIDEMPSRLLALPSDERVDAAIAELGKLVLLARAWRSAPEDPELRREAIGAESRNDLLRNPEAPRAAGAWEVLGERISTRRDGLVSVATWLLGLGEGAPRFALLLDTFPVSAGRRSGAFAAGDRFAAELAFYPGRNPLRAVIAAREDAPPPSALAWPDAPSGDPLGAFRTCMLDSPWLIERPLLLPAGRVARDGAGRFWWRSADGRETLPLAGAAPPLALGMRMDSVAGAWNGARLTLLAARTDWGRIGFDE